MDKHESMKLVIASSFIIDDSKPSACMVKCDKVKIRTKLSADSINT